MADYTQRNNSLSRTFTIDAAGSGHNLCVDTTQLSPVQWVMFTNPTGSGVTMTIRMSEFVAPGGIVLADGQSTPMLPGPWYGFYATHSGVGNKTLHVVGHY